MADRSISISLEAKVSGFVSGMKTAQQATNDFANRTASFAKDNEQHLDRVGKASMVMGGALLAGVTLAVKSFMEFDSAMSEVEASVKGTSSEMEQLRQAAIDAGADTSFSAKEAAQGIDELAKAGVSTKDILGGGLTGALSLAAAGSLEVGDAAEIAASALTQFKLSGDKVPHLADLLAAGAGKAQGSVKDLGMALNQTGLVAASTGLSIEETTGGLAAFASAGLIGSDAGTSMKTMLQRLTPQSKEAAEKMAELGISAYDSSGNFIGLSKFAENLKTSMRDLTPEARNAAMGIIFGSDAVRAANVLYKQGGEGIKEWTDKVNDSGYAAVVAQTKTDNLAGDIERLGGSFDSLLIKSGSGLAESLRGVVQGLEDMVDAAGKIPTPILNAGIGMAGTAGGALLLGGGLMTALPKVMEFRQSMKDLADASPRAASGITKVAKAAGAAATAMVALQVVGALFTEKQITSAEDYGQAILKVAKASDAASGSKDLDSLFQKWDTFAGEGPDIRDLAGAVKEVVNPHIPAGLQDTMDTLFSWTGSAKNDLGQVREKLHGLGDAMGNLVKNGAAETAAKTFNSLTEEFKKNGKGAQEALDTVPGYKDALKALALESGVVLEGQDLLDFAMGKVPASMKAAAGATEQYQGNIGELKPVTEAMSKALEDVGISAAGAIVNVDNFAKSLFNAGLLNLSASDAAIAYQDAIDKVSESVAKNGTTLDINTAAGRANQGAYNDQAKAAMESMKATAEQTLATDGAAAAQSQLQTNLRTSYDDLVAAAGQFGIVGDEADTMARKALGVPKNVNIDAWIADHASATLEGIKGRVDNIPSRKDIEINVLERTKKLTEYESIMGPTNKSASLFEAQNGGATGGRVFELAGGLAGGGKVPGGRPQNMSKDNILALVNGKPFGLQSDEWVINGRSSRDYDHELAMINAGTFPKLGFQYSPAAAPARQSVASASPDGTAPRQVNYNYTINQVDDPIGTAHAVARRQTQLGV